MSGRDVLQSALDQWKVVEKLKKTTGKILSTEDQEDVEQSTSCSADRSAQLLEETRDRRTPNGEPPVEDTEEVLRSILDRLRAPCEDPTGTPVPAK